MFDEIDDIAPTIKPGMNGTNEAFIEVHGLTVVIVIKEPDFVDTGRRQNFWQVYRPEVIHLTV